MLTRQNMHCNVCDAYYLRLELADTTHPGNELVTPRADNNEQRINTLNKIRKLINENNNIEMFCYDDIKSSIIFYKSTSANSSLR